ncbi:MAG: efflux RND transporter periplasmic adaptor subunit [Magnetococcales bacterium]|nr:efflux RND transporter periplasmic adaptor subunit [Magnetococcales bacterium]
MGFAAIFGALMVGWTCLTGQALAHGGEEHGTTSVVETSATAGLGYGGTGELFEVVVIATADGSTRLYLADAISNAPVNNAVIEAEVTGRSSWNGKADATAAAGTYRLGWSASPHEEADMTLTITVADRSDLILVRILPSSHPPTTSEAVIPPLRHGWVVAVAIPLLAFWWIGRRRRRPGGIVVLSIALAAALATTDVRAHGGEDHGAPVREMASETSLAGERMVFLPKASQFLLEMRTLAAESREVAQTIRLVGRVIPDPATYARVHPPIPARVGFDANFPPPRSGQRVSLGQTLAVLDPILSAPEKVGQRLALFKGEHAEATVSRELVLAPIGGWVTDVHIVPGEVVTENTLLAEIIDPARLWVEAILYDLPMAERIIGGMVSSRQAPGRGWPLRLVGVSPKVNPENQGLHLQFAVETGAEGPGWLKPGMPVDVHARIGDLFFTVAVPRDAVVERGGIPLAWVKTAPERFEGHPLRLGRRTSAWVEVLEGIKTGDKVVIRGHNQLNAMR